MLIRSQPPGRTGIDVVICNAGVMAVPQRLETLDGFEMQPGDSAASLLGFYLVNHRKTIGKPLENGGLMGFNRVL